MNIDLSRLVLGFGVLQISVLIASSLVPIVLKWRMTLGSLPKLCRQLIWIYGGYTAMTILMLGLVCVFFHEELASGTGLARAVCFFIALFWGVRLCLQPFLDAKPYLNKWWLRCGYHALTIVFLATTTFFAILAMGPCSPVCPP